jgi:hypothetical protein
MSEDITVTEKQLTDEEIKAFRDALMDTEDDDHDDPRNLFIGIWTVVRVWFATIFAIWIIWQLAHLPGIP